MAQTAETGRIAGKVVEVQGEKPVDAATVYLEDTRLGSVADGQGRYEIKAVPPGSYTLVISKVGYRKVVQQVSVPAGRTVHMDFRLETEVYQMDELLIESIVPEDEDKNEDKLLRQRQQAVEIQDAIGSEDMSRTASGDAAEAVSKVTGASVVDGKYVYIRGLGERYSMTQLNGSELPSPDPYRKAVQMDLFPSSLLDRIVATKTFSPDMPGNFSGGSVEMWTKRFPESFTFNFSQSVAYNTQATFNDKMLVYPGGGSDWLGMDDGTRAVPAMLKDPAFVIPDIGKAWSDKAAALELDRISKAFNPVMAPSTEKGPVNQSYSLSMGNQFKLFGRPLGVLGSFSYSRKASFYDNGTVGRWQLTGTMDKTDDLNNDFLLNDVKGSDEALWGGLINAAYKITGNHEIGLNYMCNQSGESSARYLAGQFPRDLTGNAIYETRVLKYTERTLNSFQLRGEHDLPELFSSHLEWTGSFNFSGQIEPDLRYFTDNYTVRERNGTVDTLYSIRPSIYPKPNRYFRDLSEDNMNFDLKVSLPFKQWKGLHSQMKVGGAYNEVERHFRERRFEFSLDDSKYGYQGDPYEYWMPSNVGLMDSTGKLNRFANYVLDASELRGNYDGKQRIAAGFAMVELPITTRLQFIGGVRLENTRMSVVSHDSTLGKGGIDENDLLPATNLIYLLSDNMNLRAAYGRTLARPTFREMAPYASFDFVNDYTFIGNENLKRTLIDNFDLRWEWFARGGEVFAVSAFYKKFTNPIERVIKNVNAEVQYQNVDRADVVGAEFEARQRLDRIHPALEPFRVGVNLALVHS
ncbi:MAG: TonB-dependent receptor, partial [Candidatus Glassbacteria bacterium]|nr:TonB-dependent receptor [Candidatus Glassbacteria bacterium]